MLYVAVDIGCIECGEDSAVLGIFDSMERAEQVKNDHFSRHKKNWNGEHSFEVFEVSAINEEIRISY